MPHTTTNEAPAMLLMKKIPRSRIEQKINRKLKRGTMIYM